MNKIKSQLKQVAFPREHGSWGYTLEPLMLSLLVGFTKEGFFLALASFFIFLSHQPVRIIFNKKFNLNYKIKAYTVLGIYSLISILSFGVVFITVGPNKLTLFLIALLLMFGYLLLELNHVKRTVLAELIAAASVGIIASNIVLLAGWPRLAILGFWIIVLSRAVPTTFYVRGMLQMAKKQKINEISVIISSFVSIFIIAILIFLVNIPSLTIFAVLMMVVRAYFGMYKSSEKINVKKLGIMEFGFGILFVIIVAIGYNFNI